MVLGAIILYRVHKRNSNTSSDLDKNNNRTGKRPLAEDASDEEDGLLQSKKKPKLLGQEIMDQPIIYKDSYMVPTEWNPIINTYIK